MKVFEDQGQLTVEIEPSRAWRAYTRDFSLIALWAALAWELSRNAPPPQLRDQFVVNWTARLTLGFLCVLGLLRVAWRYWGREEIVVRGGVISVVRRLGFLGWQRAYRIEQVKDLHVSTIGLTRQLWIFGGTLAFDCDGKTGRFADRLDRNEAKTVLRHFREWLPQSNWTQVLGL